MHKPLVSPRRGLRLELTATLALIFGCLLGACSQRSETPALGNYRAILELPAGEAPFGLEVARERGTYRLYLLNGNQRTAIPAVTIAERELRAQLPGGATLIAAIYRDHLEGEVALAARGARAAPIPFRATLGADYRFYAQPATDNADVEGQWRVVLAADGRQNIDGLAMFEQRFDRLVGTIVTATGRARTVEGQVNGDDLALSAFDGETVLLYQLRVDESGNLVGEYWQDLDGRGTLRATRDAHAAI